MNSFSILQNGKWKSRWQWKKVGPQLIPLSNFHKHVFVSLFWPIGPLPLSLSLNYWLSLSLCVLVFQDREKGNERKTNHRHHSKEEEAAIEREREIDKDFVEFLWVLFLTLLFIMAVRPNSHPKYPENDFLLCYMYAYI